MKHYLEDFISPFEYCSRSWVANLVFPISLSPRSSLSWVTSRPLFNHQVNMSVRHSCAKSGQFLLLAWIRRSLWRGTPSCSPNCLQSAATGSLTRSFSSERGIAIAVYAATEKCGGGAESADWCLVLTQFGMSTTKMSLGWVCMRACSKTKEEIDEGKSWCLFC